MAGGEPKQQKGGKKKKKGLLMTNLVLILKLAFDCVSGLRLVTALGTATTQQAKAPGRTAV